MKKALKIMALILAGLILFSFLALFLFIKTLPSAWDIKQAITPKSAQAPEFVAESPNPSTTLPTKKTQSSPAPVKTHDEKIDEGKERVLRVVREDFMNPQKPMVRACKILGRAKDSRFLRKKDAGSMNEFMKSLADEKEKDPVVEAAAPLFRFITRLPAMTDLLQRIDHARAEENGAFSKMGFYTQVGRVGQELVRNKPSIDRLAMKSYNLFALTRAVGIHPELAKDPATINFCEQIEKNINMNLEFNLDEQATELTKFLSYAQVTPEEIGYDPTYRADTEVKVNPGAVSTEHLWLEELFQADIRKYQSELKR